MTGRTTTKGALYAEASQLHSPAEKISKTCGLENSDRKPCGHNESRPSAKFCSCGPIVSSLPPRSVADTFTLLRRCITAQVFFRLYFICCGEEAHLEVVSSSVSIQNGRHSRGRRLVCLHERHIIQLARERDESAGDHGVSAQRAQADLLLYSRGYAWKLISCFCGGISGAREGGPSSAVQYSMTDTDFLKLHNIL